MRHQLITTIVAILLLSACGQPTVQKQTSADADLQYLTYGSYGGSLFIRKVFSPIKVHIAGNYGGSINNNQQVVDAINKWLAPLRKISNRAITNDIVVGNFPSNYQLKINLHNACGRANAFDNEINLFIKGFKNSFTPDYSGSGCTPMNNVEVLLHELGHTLGLGDTYNESGGCMAGQPDSVMCYYKTNLTADDIAGVNKVFCSIFAENCGGKIADSGSTTTSTTTTPTTTKVTATTVNCKISVETSWDGTGDPTAYVRSQPSSKSSKVATVNQGDSFDVKKMVKSGEAFSFKGRSSSVWYQVSVPGSGPGWLWGEYAQGNCPK